MILTKESLNALKSKNGGFNKQILDILNPRGFSRGWFKRLIGTYISEEDYNKAKAIKDSHLNKNFTSPAMKLDKIILRLDMLEMKLDDIMELINPNE